MNQKKHSASKTPTQDAVTSATSAKNIAGRIRKADLYLLAGCLFLALFSFFLYKVYYHEDGGTVVITVDGTVCGQLPLNENATFTIPQDDNASPNILTVRDGSASMTEAHCPDKLCMHQKKISKTGETIICLPRKIVISIEGSNKNEMDGIAY